MDAKQIPSEALVKTHNAAAVEPTDMSDLQSMLSTAELSRRPSRPPDYATESRALVALAREMAASPETILQKLAETALAVCRAHSAGLSLLEDRDGRTRFHWRAIAGQWSPHVDGGTPRDFGPCGTVLDRNIAMICSRPERDFPYWAPIKPVLEEGLLIPFYVKGEAVGTIWVVAHDTSRRFDAEDLRVMNSLGTFAAAAYQAHLNVSVAQQSASIVDSSDDAIVSKDLKGVISSWNRGAERIFGYAAEEVVGKPIIILIPAERHDEEKEILQRIGRGERIDHYETVRRRKDGSLVDISLSVSPVKTVEGKIIGASKIARDITERKRAAERIMLLAREVDHRAKNLMAVMQAVVHFTQAETPEDFRTAIEGRLRAVAKAHDLFAETRWKGADIHSVVTEELAPYSHNGEARAAIDGPSLLLEPNKAQIMAIVVHELTTNAAKYGALSSSTGHVRVEWRCVDGRFVFGWIEKGGPPVKAPTRHGFGTGIIERMVRQLGGDVRFDWHSDGLVCEVAIPQVPTPASTL
jgi:PAS domain S-box-containing protein